MYDDPFIGETMEAPHMNIKRLLAPVAIAAALAMGACGGGSTPVTSADANPNPTNTYQTSVPTTEPAPQRSWETEPPTAEPTTPSPSAERTAREFDNSVPTLVVPQNTVALTCNMPKGGLPKLEETSSNDYPRIMLNAICGAERKAGHKGSYRWGQVGTEDAIACQNFTINGADPRNVAWWCDGHNLLISSPAEVEANYGSDAGLMRVQRDLVAAYAVAYVRTHNKAKSLDLRKTTCVMGRAILNLRVKRMVSTGRANLLMDDITQLLDQAGYSSVNLALRKGYNGASC